MKKKILFSSKEENLSEIFNQISINKFLIVFISILFMLLFHFKASFDEKKIILIEKKNIKINLSLNIGTNQMTSFFFASNP